MARVGVEELIGIDLEHTCERYKVGRGGHLTASLPMPDHPSIDTEFSADLSERQLKSLP
jgi:hypothetical protein